MPRLTFAVLVLVAAAGCQKTNPDYCPNGATADLMACIDAPPGTGDHCTGDDGCKADPNLPFCDKMVNGGTCVQCTPDHTNVCTGSTPHCELDTGTCVGCVDDNDCGGTGVCLPTGSCAAPDAIFYAVSKNGSIMADCGTSNKPCTLDQALSLVTSSAKNIIKLTLTDPAPYTSSMPNYIINVDATVGLTIDARGATLHAKDTDNPVFIINSNKGMTILGGTIENATGSNSDGIRCNTNATLTVDGTTIASNGESAIDASSCTLTVKHAIIRGNSQSGSTFPGIQIVGGSSTISRSSITANQGGGITVTNGKFAIVGNVLLSNGTGDTSGLVGGISINTAIPGNRLEFNTITQNQTTQTVLTAAAGVSCPNAAVGFTAQNNIIWNNNSSAGTSGIQISGACLHAYSDIGPGTLPTINDTQNAFNNLNADPSFVNDMTDLHLQPSTMVRGKANPSTMLTDTTDLAARDMDGKRRVQPADLGAYVAPPQ